MSASTVHRLVRISQEALPLPDGTRVFSASWNEAARCIVLRVGHSSFSPTDTDDNENPPVINVLVSRIESRYSDRPMPVGFKTKEDR